MWYDIDPIANYGWLNKFHYFYMAVLIVGIALELKHIAANKIRLVLHIRQYFNLKFTVIFLRDKSKLSGGRTSTDRSVQLLTAKYRFIIEA